jgi:nitrate/nitrite-specific signal transduction histidine kinase
VLARAGLPSALRDLAAAAATRGGLTVDVDADGWPAGEHTAADPLLYRTAGELLNNVVKHAQATSATVTLALTLGQVADDGVGLQLTPRRRRCAAATSGCPHALGIDAARADHLHRQPAARHGGGVALPVRQSEDTCLPADRRTDCVDARAVVDASGEIPQPAERHPP